MCVQIHPQKSGPFIQDQMAKTRFFYFCIRGPSSIVVAPRSSLDRTHQKRFCILFQKKKILYYLVDPTCRQQDSCSEKNPETAHSVIVRLVLYANPCNFVTLRNHLFV